MRHMSETLHDALYDLLPDQGPIEWAVIQRCKEQMHTANYEGRQDGERCPDCGSVIFDGQCGCAEADAKIYDAKERGDV